MSGTETVLDLEKRKHELEELLPNWEGQSRRLVALTSEYGKSLSKQKETLVSTSSGKKTFNKHARFLRGLKAQLEDIVIQDAAGSIVKSATAVLDAAEDLYRNDQVRDALNKLDQVSHLASPLTVEKFAALESVKELQKRVRETTKRMKAGKPLPMKKETSSIARVSDQADDQYNAATKIQAVHRGRQARKEVAVVRKKRREEKEEREKQEAAAIRIQAVQRGRNDRKKVAELTEKKLEEQESAQESEQESEEESEESEQSEESAEESEKEEEESAESEAEADEEDKAMQEAAAIKIQAVQRGRKARRETIELRNRQSNKVKLPAFSEEDAAIRIQAVQRGRRARRETIELRNRKSNKVTLPALSEEQAAVKIQAIQRGRRARRETIELRNRQSNKVKLPPLSEEEAATKIQAVQRGRKARRETVELRNRQSNKVKLPALSEEQAAVKIQAVQRGRKARRETVELRDRRAQNGQPQKRDPAKKTLTPRTLSKKEKRMRQNLASLENEERMRKNLTRLQKEERERESKQDAKPVPASPTPKKSPPKESSPKKSSPVKKDSPSPSKPVKEEDTSWRRYATKHREDTGRAGEGPHLADTENLERELLQLRHALQGRDMEIAHLRRSLAIPTHQVSEMRKALVKLNSEVEQLRGKKHDGPMPKTNPFVRDQSGKASPLAPGSNLASAWEAYYASKSARTRDRHTTPRDSPRDGKGSEKKKKKKPYKVPREVAQNLAYKYAPLANPIPDPLDALPTPRDARLVRKRMTPRSDAPHGRDHLLSQINRAYGNGVEDVLRAIEENDMHANAVIADLDDSLRHTKETDPLERPSPRRQFKYQPFNAKSIDQLARVTLTSHSRRYKSPQRTRAQQRRAKTAHGRGLGVTPPRGHNTSLPDIPTRAKSAHPTEQWSPATPASVLVAKSQEERRRSRQQLGRGNSSHGGTATLLAVDRLDPRQWSKEEVEDWLLRVQERHEMYDFDTTALWVNGRTLCQLSEPQLKEVAPGLDGSIIYNELRELLEAQLHRESYMSGGEESDADAQDSHYADDDSPMLRQPVYEEEEEEEETVDAGVLFGTSSPGVHLPPVGSR